jgi:hypothetical protein
MRPCNLQIFVTIFTAFRLTGGHYEARGACRQANNSKIHFGLDSAWGRVQCWNVKKSLVRPGRPTGPVEGEPVSALAQAVPGLELAQPDSSGLT